MHENIITIIRADEAETLLLIKPFDFSFWHNLQDLQKTKNKLLKKQDRVI
jgi:hypothetical protein